jgi:hypothetical protein
MHCISKPIHFIVQEKLFHRAEFFPSAHKSGANIITVGQTWGQSYDFVFYNYNISYNTNFLVG